MSNQIQIDKTLLTQEQRAELESYHELFASPGWRYVQERFAPVAQRYQMELESVSEQVELGRIQGGLRVLREVIGFLPTSIDNEYLHLTGQLGGSGEQDDGLSDRDPVQPGNS